MSPAKEKRYVEPHIAARSALERNAKAAYEQWAYRVGVNTAWEYLPREHMAAWKEVVALVQSDAECARCGEALLCTNCNSEDVYRRRFLNAAVTLTRILEADGNG